jgi:hypothetical protein
MDSTLLPQAVHQRRAGLNKTNFAQQKLGMYQAVAPASPVYSRPGSSCSQPPTLFNNGHAVLTPTGSPPSSHHTSAVMLETEFSDNPYFPSTPPLSTSGSTVGSPKSFDVLQTPLNPMFSGLDGFTSAKSAFESIESSILDWTSCDSPPMTPGKRKTHNTLL